MGFLDEFGSALSDSVLGSVGLAENKPSSLDTTAFGYEVPGSFSALGDFAKKIDRSAHRQYIETGVIRNHRPRGMEVISQEPDITVLVKKRLFSSLKGNYKANLLDDDELTFIRATKALFENKCRAISSYERLFKYDKIASKNNGIISDYALPGFFNALDTLNAFGPTSGLIDAKTQATLESVRKVKAFSDPNFFTTWIQDDSLPFASPIGGGTGVFELTLVSGFNSTTSTEFGGGSASIKVEDPYKLMLVNNDDIDRAISDASNRFKQNNFFKLTESQLESAINDLSKKLNEIRVGSGAPAIRFLINEDTILHKKIKAIIDLTGRELLFVFDAGMFGSALFSFDNSAVQVDQSALEGNDGLQGIEVDLFKQIIQNMYTLLSLKQTTRSEIKLFNKKTNAVRKKMRLHYANKPIIQPMDVISIFVSSKTVKDSMLNKGLGASFAQGSLMNQIDNTLGNLEAAWEDIQQTFSGGTKEGSYLETEKNAIAGPEFPMWLWGMMRNDFTKQGAGTCVFNGITKSTSHSYSDGKYMLSVNIEDNTRYFDKGIININPSLEVFNSALYDPLTPFKTDFDESSGVSRGEVPELLEVNKRLLNSGAIRAKLGKLKGKPLNEEEFNKRDVEHVASSISGASSGYGRQYRLKFINPDGFVYRWKEGIGSLVLFGEPYSDLTKLGSIKGERSRKITIDPYAGQDTMNVLSLLITGQPYNFNTFMRGALQGSNQLSKDDLFNDTIASSFFKGLISDVSIQNSVWGSFIPFKKLVVNESEYVFLAAGYADLIGQNKTLNRLLRERAELFDQLSSAAPQYRNTPSFTKIIRGGKIDKSDNPISLHAITDLQGKIFSLDSQIKVFQKDFDKSKKSLVKQSDEGTLSIFGDDISFDPTLTLADDANTEKKRLSERRELRDKINTLTLRRLWKVKSNEDQNLFIVDDSYDKNYDIQQFERALSGSQMEKFKSDYATIFSQIESVKQMLGLEIFADSQGHIRARPPQYNKVPNSVFRDMLQTKVQKGIKIFPEYLESLFFNRIEGITGQLEIVEDQIRLYAAALGADDDSKAQTLVGKDFTFLTKVSNDGQYAKFGQSDIRSLFKQTDPDVEEQINSKALDDIVGDLDDRINATVNFDVVKKIDVVVSAGTFTSNPDETVIQQIANRLKQKTNNTNIPSSVQAILANDREPRDGKSQVGILKATTKISEYVYERQRLMKSLSPAISSLRGGLSINSNDDTENVGDKLLFPNLSSDNDKNFPEILENMIEDENNHDLGPGSGTRFILSDEKIISFELNNKEPPYNSVQVDGRLGQGIVSLDQGLQTSNGGNAIGSAWATDYSMWEMYGLRVASPVTIPFFQDPVTQCAPYAVYLLNLAREQVLTASITVIGNEYIQAGEVYYIEDYDLLFYAKSVSHSFSYNGRFTTSMELTFGHNPGEYIPTQLDIIGKGLYTNKHQADLIRQVRHGRADNSSHIGIAIHDTSPKEAEISVKSLIGGRFGEQNRKSLSNILLSLSGALASSSFSEISTIELRVYKNTADGISGSDDLKQIAESIKTWIVNPRKVNLEGENSTLPDTNVNWFIDDEVQKRIKVEVVDLDPKVIDPRSPSSQAWSIVRSIVEHDNMPLVEAAVEEQQEAAADNDVAAGNTEELIQKELSKREVQMMSNAIIDVWVSFATPKSIVSETSKK